ncbi:MAG: divergent PAP2 family protein, partial [Chloroflexi bacterium]|nr:divergent PAP2 family protein [Chloroflexota bacterium]
ASGVRRQAGAQARVINAVVADLPSGQAITDEKLLEAVGHTRVEVFAGIAFGIVVMLAWKLGIQPLFVG